MMSKIASRGLSPLDDVVAEAVEHLALLVHHVVVLKRAFADGEVVLLDAALGGLDGAVQQRMLQLLALLHAELFHDVGDAAAAEQPHQIVFERDVEPRTARVALARATSAKLPVDAPRFVPLAADDVQAADDR